MFVGFLSDGLVSVVDPDFVCVKGRWTDIDDGDFRWGGRDSRPGFISVTKGVVL